MGKPYKDPNPFDGSLVFPNIRQYVLEVGPPSWTYGDIQDYGEWRMFSIGPDKKYNPIGTADLTMGWIYDPTNGTISSGMILRTQKDTKGEFFSRS